MNRYSAIVDFKFDYDYDDIAAAKCQVRVFPVETAATVLAKNTQEAELLFRLLGINFICVTTAT